MEASESAAPTSDGVQEPQTYQPEGNPGLEFFAGADGDAYFRLKGRNGEIVHTSEGYTTLADAHRGFEDLTRIVVMANGVPPVISALGITEREGLARFANGALAMFVNGGEVSDEEEARVAGTAISGIVSLALSIDAQLASIADVLERYLPER
jgi:uncharacterized protein YegP (UPF0339 family)